MVPEMGASHQEALISKRAALIVAANIWARATRWRICQSGNPIDKTVGILHKSELERITAFARLLILPVCGERVICVGDGHVGLS